MNHEESPRSSEEKSEERVAGLLREAVPRLIPRRDPDELVERVLARGTDRLFSCDSPLGEAYAWVAREAGSPKASRAVGTVVANNPVPLVVPCHRVIKNDGTTGQYAFGAGEKVGLLEGEGVPIGELAGAPYLATPTTGIFCHATCRNAKKIKPENRRRFRSAEAAVEAGFRPCKVCRPVVAR